jgi:hypothetical protein
MRTAKACTSIIVGLFAPGAMGLACSNGGAPAPVTRTLYFDAARDGGTSQPERPARAGERMADAELDAASDAEAPMDDDSFARRIASCSASTRNAVHAPDGGVCMNNAMTSADAGSNDRCAAVIEAMRPKLGDFACCYELFEPTKEGRNHAVLDFELEPNGAVRDVALAGRERQPSGDRVQACVAFVARAIRFPASPAGRPTRIRFPLDMDGSPRR